MLLLLIAAAVVGIVGEVQQNGGQMKHELQGRVDVCEDEADGHDQHAEIQPQTDVATRSWSTCKQRGGVLNNSR